MIRPGAQLAVAAEELIVSLFPAVFPKTPDLSNLLSILLERRQLTKDADDDEDDDEIEPFQVWPILFQINWLSKFLNGYPQNLKKTVLGGLMN